MAAVAANFTPRGCGPNVDSLYHNLCDLDAAWGVVVEAAAVAGVVFSFVLLVALLASIPFVQDENRRRAVPLQAGFLVCTAGLFCLTFAFVVGKDFSTCAARRFLFGVLFGGCFACLLMQSVQLNVLARRGGGGPRAGPLLLGAMALWLVEVVVNTEWLIITVVRHPLGPPNATDADGRAAAVPCNIANEDFVMALVYVMVLMAAVLLATLAVMVGKRKEWKTEAAFVLMAVLFSVAIWVAWIVMYVYGNGTRGRPTWDDPTLAVALAANGWAFLVFYTIPGVCCLTADDESQQGFGDDLYASRGVGYENILKEQSSQNLFMENKAFSMDEPSQASKPVSPYSGYTGQLRSSVYQPTELALISKASTSPPAPDPCAFDVVIPRASASPAVSSGSSTPSAHAVAANGTYEQVNGHGTGKWVA